MSGLFFLVFQKPQCKTFNINTIKMKVASPIKATKNKKQYFPLFLDGAHTLELKMRSQRTGCDQIGFDQG